MNERTGSELRKVPFSRSQRLWGQSDTKSQLLFHAASFTWSRGKCCVSSPQAHTLQEHGSSQQLFYYVFLNDFLLHKENISILHMKKIFDFYLSFFLYLCFGARDKQYSRGWFSLNTSCGRWENLVDDHQSCQIYLNNPNVLLRDLPITFWQKRMNYLLNIG